MSTNILVYSLFVVILMHVVGIYKICGAIPLLLFHQELFPDDNQPNIVMVNPFLTS